MPTTVLNATFPVSPNTQQNARTPPFPFPLHSVLTITARGTIGSGVLFTGVTPPGGWPTPVGAGDTNWPLHDGLLGRPYSLIATFDATVPGNEAEWFFVGDRVSKISDARIPMARLRLAVNRPHPDERAAGDGQWLVHVQVDVPNAGENTRPPDCATSPLPPPTTICQAMLSSLDDLRGQAHLACNNVISTRTEETTANILLGTAGVVLAAAVGGLLGFGASLAGAHIVVVPGSVGADAAAAGPAAAGGFIERIVSAIAEGVARGQGSSHGRRAWDTYCILGFGGDYAYSSCPIYCCFD